MKFKAETSFFLILPQFCVHTDKKELINALTKDLHAGADYSAVVYQLGAATAQGKQ